MAPNARSGRHSPPYASGCRSGPACAEELVAREVRARTQLLVPGCHLDVGLQSGVQRERAHLLSRVDIELDVVHGSVRVSDLVKAASIANPTLHRDRPPLIRLARALVPLEPVGMVEIEYDLTSRS